MIQAVGILGQQINSVLPQNISTNLTNAVSAVKEVFNVLKQFANVPNISASSFTSISGYYDTLLGQPLNVTQNANLAPK